VAAVVYYRTSSTSNVGPDKDSAARQRDAVAAYARARGLQIVADVHAPDHVRRQGRRGVGRAVA
jgi:DNA invertase Pin-like site-specific DNA recombinase